MPTLPADATPPVTPLAAARTGGGNHRPRRVVDRVGGILAAIVSRHGPFSADRTLDAGIRESFYLHFRDTFSMMPAMLADPLPGIRYALFGPGMLLACDPGGRLATVGWSPRAAGPGDFVAPQPALSGDPRSVFHWERDMRAAPVGDPVSAAAAAGPLEAARAMLRGQGAGSERPPVLGRLLNRQLGRRTPTDLVPPDIRRACETSGSGMTGAVHAASCLLSAKLDVASARAFAFAARKMVDPRLLAAARRCGDLDLYWWLAAHGLPDGQASVASARRLQFSVAYPELVSGVAASGGRGHPASAGAPDTADGAADGAGAMARIGRAVDAASGAAPAVAGFRSWQPWVERALRGRLTATRAMGAYRCTIPREGDREGTPGGMQSALFDSVARSLGELGPSWKPRHGDDGPMAFLCSAAGHLGMDARTAIGKACPDPAGPGASPWKRVFRRVPEGYRPSRDPGRPRRDPVSAVDELSRAFCTDVLLPLAPEGTDMEVLPARKGAGRGRAAGGHAGPPPPFRAHLPALLALVDEWHRRIDTIRVAKAGYPGRPAAGKAPVSWSAAFEPVPTPGGLLLSCVTDAASLSSHGTLMDNCIGSYAPACLTECFHVVSVTDGDRPVASACYEISGGSARRREASGRSNGALPPGAAAALDALDRSLHGSPEGERPLPGIRLAPARELEAECRARKADRTRGEAILRSGYDAGDPVAAEAVLLAWRFAWPPGLAAARKSGDGAAGRMAAVSAWISASYGRPMG